MDHEIFHFNWFTLRSTFITQQPSYLSKNPFVTIKFCEDQGTILVETPSAYAKTEVTNYFNRTNTGLASTAQYWTGLKYNDTAMSFIWNATGTQFTSASFSDWYMNKTNSDKNQS